MVIICNSGNNNQHYGDTKRNGNEEDKDEAVKYKTLYDYLNS